MNVTRRAMISAAGLALLTVTGCSEKPAASKSENQPDSNAGQAKVNKPKQLELVESGYSVTDNGYVMYGVAIKNPNADFEAQFPSFTITGKADDGSIVFSDKQTCRVVFPGETMHYGFQAGNGVPPASVEFSLQDPKWVESNGLSGELLTISNTSEVPGRYGNTSFTGELSANSDVDKDVISQVALTVITRDESGAINFGTTTFCEMPDMNQSVPFDIPTYSIPDHSSYEIYAQVW